MLFGSDEGATYIRCLMMSDEEDYYIGGEGYFPGYGEDDTKPFVAILNPEEPVETMYTVFYVNDEVTQMDACAKDSVEEGMYFILKQPFSVV